jgi:hypothetical protein
MPVTSRIAGSALLGKPHCQLQNRLKSWVNEGVCRLALLVVICDIFPVGGLLLSTVLQQNLAPGPLISTHMFWIGLLVGILAVWIFPGWVSGILFFIALLVSGILSSFRNHAHSTEVPFIIVGIIALVIGLYFGRIRGLRQLGESDFRTRFTNIRGIRRWF